MTMTMATTATDLPPTSPTIPPCAWPLAAASRIRVKLVQQEEQLQRWRQRRRGRNAHDVDPTVAAAAAAAADGGDDDSATYCRFFYDSKSGAIVLIPINDDDDDEQQQQQKRKQKQRVVYDDNDDISILEQEPSYLSYITTLNAMIAADDSGDGNTYDYDNNDNADDAKRIVSIVDSFHPKDVIGANLSFDTIENDKDNSTASSAANVTASINIYQYPKLNNNKKREPYHKQYLLDPICCMDFADVRVIIQAIQKLSQPRSSSSSNNNNKQQRSDDNAALPSAPPSATPSISTSSHSSSHSSSQASPPPHPTTTATSTPILTPMKCLIILNPYSGGGGPNSKNGAKNVYTTIVKQMLLESMNVVEFDTLVTQRAGHARERMRMIGKGKEEEDGGGRQMMDQVEREEVDDDDKEEEDASTLNTDTETKDISHYNAILAMGGDGILFEILQGIHARSDEAAIFSKLKFAILPCGTYNGLATSILHWSCISSSSSDNAANEDANDVEEENVKADPWDYLEMMFHVCKGYTSTLDIASYRVLRPANTTTSITDVEDANSNVIGDNTAASSAIITNVTATKNIASNSSIINNPENDNNVVSSSYLSFLTYAWGLIADCDYESECLRWLGHVRSDIWALYRGILCRKRYRGRFSYLPPSPSSSNSDGEKTKSTMERSAQEETVVLPTLGEPLPKGWVTYDCDDFLVFWVCNTTHAAHNMHTCSVAKMNDGLFHVLIVRSSCSRLRLLLMLLHLDSGGHMEYPGLEYVPCLAYQFEPLSDVSYNVLDGELLEDGTVQACFMPGGAQFFVGEGVGSSSSTL